MTICLFYNATTTSDVASAKGYFGLLHGALIAALRRECYPTELVIGVEIVFLSQQAVKHAGGFWAYWH